MKKSLLPLLLLSLLISCGNEIEHKQIFLPDTIDGVTYFLLSDHTKEDHFTGSWEAPLLSGKEKKKSRRPGKRAGKLKFISLKKEKYILHTDFFSPDNQISISLGNSRIELEGQKKFLSKKLIREGENFISFFPKRGMKLNNISVFPKRILRTKNYQELIKDERTLFLPGSLRYFIKPENNEYLNLKLDLQGRESTELKILLSGENKKKESRKKIKNGVSFTIRLLQGEFQEVLISLPGLKNGYLTVSESSIVHKINVNKKNEDRIKKVRDLVSGKNLLFILLDATRNDRTGYNGYIRRTTPNIDKFAINSLVFSNCYSEASYTLASTGTLLTGLPPDYHGVISSFYSSLNKRVTTLAEMFLTKDYFTGAISANPNFGRAYKLDKGFTKFDELFLNNPVVQAEEFLDPFQKMLDNSGDKPFFVYLHLREPHDPFAMPPPFLTKFQNEFQKMPEKILSIYMASEGKYKDKKGVSILLGKLYDGNLAYGDMVFGKILDILRRRGLTSDTIIVFLSDHGEAIGEHGVYGHGHVLYQQSMRIPLVIKIPGLKGETYNSQVITSDLVRTLSDIFKLPYPYKMNSYGRNLLIQGKKRRLFVRSINAYNYPGYMVQQYPYKLIIHFPYNDKTMELFNLETDPGENHAIRNRPLIKKTLLFYLFNHLRSASKIKQGIVNPELRKDDIKSLESLGYL